MKIAVVNNPPYPEADLYLKENVNFYSGINGFIRSYKDATSLEKDLFCLASSIFCADLSYKRCEREEFLRDINITIPVVNLHAFERVKDDILMALYLLSNDNWQINFIQKEGTPEAKFKAQENVGSTLLFSGGLDSLSAAIEYLSKGKRMHLVSHITRNRVTRGVQETLYTTIQKMFGDNVTRDYFYVSGHTAKDFPFPRDKDREESQRTRSFLFLVLAGIITRRKGFKDILMIAENGQLAIHLPLTSARLSSFSTHTAHPEYIIIMEKILSKLLNFNVKIFNPYLYKTKAQVVSKIVKFYPELVKKSVSCWRGSRITGKNHCGECVPCLIRRISLESNKLAINEYERDILNEDILHLPEDDLGKRNLIDLLEFIHHFSNCQNENYIIEYYPEIVNESFVLKEAIKMYQRFSDEALKVFAKYPKVMEAMK